MSIATHSILAPSLSKGLLLLIALLFLGMLTLIAVAQLKLDCANEYLTSDDGKRLATDKGRLLTTGRYWLVVGNMAVLLPEHAQPVLIKLGFMPTECR